jgi:predicted nucleic acid-binding protein
MMDKKLFADLVDDCLTKTHAIFASTPLLHRDRDFGLIAGVEPN